MTTAIDIDATLQAYVECALWSSTDQSDDTGGRPLDENYGPEDLASGALDAMRADVADFIEGCAEDLERSGLSGEQVGHDFWLTRNGHGAGFWDHGLGELGERLSAMARPYGECYLDAHDDGLIYVYPS